MLERAVEAKRRMAEQRCASADIRAALSQPRSDQMLSEHAPKRERGERFSTCRMHPVTRRRAV
jgi:hypothetical protein